MANLTNEQIKEVQDSWEIAKNLGIDTIGRVFYQRVFSLAPEALQLFQSFNSVENMYESQIFKKHARNVVLTVGRAVAGLRDLETIAPHLVELGRRHFDYGITDDLFPVIGHALLYTLELGLGEQFTPTVKTAWGHAYEIIADCMKKGLNEAKEKHDAEVAAKEAEKKDTKKDDKSGSCCF